MSVTLGELPNEGRASVEDHENPGDDAPQLGLTVAPAAKVMDSSSEGVVVTAINPDGRTAQQGVKVGDVILDVGGKAVSTPADVRDAHQNRGARRLLASQVAQDQRLNSLTAYTEPSRRPRKLARPLNAHESDTSMRSTAWPITWKASGQTLSGSIVLTN